MRLKKLTVSNVFSLGQIELDLDRRGLVLVTGYSHDEGDANGSGKSSLANKSILWCLFGQTAGGLKADDVINRHTSPPHFVQLEVEGSDNKIYTIKRSRKPASLELHCGEQRLTQRNEKETQELINTIIGRNYTNFIYSDFFGQGREGSFLSLPPKDQKEILEKILPIAQLSKWSDSAAKHKAEILTQIAITETNISIAKGGLAQLKSTLEAQKIKITTWASNQEGLIQNRVQAAAKYRAQNASAINEIAALEKTLETFTIPDDVSKEHNEAFETLMLRQSELRKAEQSFSSWRSELERQNSIINNKDPDQCGSCGQRLPEVVLQTRESNIAKAKDKFLSIKLTLEQADTAVKFYKEQVMCLTKRAKEYESQVLNRQRALKEKTILQDQLSTKRAAVNTDYLVKLESEISILKAQTNPYVMDTSLQQSIISEQSKLEDAQKILASLVMEKDRLGFWQDAFGKDLKIYLLDRVCPFLTERVSKHLEGLGNSQIKVTFNTTKQLKSGESRDEFSCDVRSSTGGCGYDSLSGGEAQIVSFAIGLALADLAESQAVGLSRILILDEPFMSLDGRNSENLVNYIVGTLAQRRETILLVSNEESLKTLVPSIVHVVKQNGVTSICQQP